MFHNSQKSLILAGLVRLVFLRHKAVNLSTISAEDLTTAVINTIAAAGIPAEKLSSLGDSFLNLLQEGSIGWLRAVYSFHPEKGYLFQTFASLVSENAMIDYVRKCASAILDRLLHHSHIVNIVGPSYRTKDVLEKLEESKKKEYQAT
ncbi:sigma factor [Sharpea azabuensis]|uniref:sigma factor n=1 Tax=Sharpea azabuensis TaxID=322505 RepID=UPI003AF33BE2